MNETVFTNARLITPDAVVEGTLVVRDGHIVSLDNGASTLAERIDLEGDYLMPGLVELHTDNLEKHFIPRPKVLWPQGVPAFFAHDAQIVASGITTVFDALSVGEYHDKGRIAMLGKAVGALNSCRSTGKLRSEHLLHLRCEVADPRMQDLFFPLSDTPALSLVSLMDHTPGQRQWRDTSSYRTYYSNIASWTDEEFEQVVERLQTARDGCAEDNAASIMAFCGERACRWRATTTRLWNTLKKPSITALPSASSPRRWRRRAMPPKTVCSCSWSAQRGARRVALGEYLRVGDRAGRVSGEPLLGLCACQPS